MFNLFSFIDFIISYKYLSLKPTLHSLKSDTLNFDNLSILRSEELSFGNEKCALEIKSYIKY